MSGHEVSIEGDVVRKRYLRTDRGEPGREWAALVLLHEHAPGLAPRPLARGSDPPVVRRALAAAREWHAHRPAGLDRVSDPVLAQGDGRVDNVLWDGRRMRLVDFEASGVGDLAFEVADLVEHVSARLRGRRDVDAVLAGFGLGAEQEDRVASYRVVLASFWLLMLLPGGAGHDQNPQGSDARQAEHLLTLLGKAGP